MIGGGSPARTVIRMDYLAKLNPDQRAAVEHGVADARRAAAAGHRGRGLGQDRHAGAPRRASGDERRRSAPHPAADLLAPRRRRDGAARASASSNRATGTNATRRADLVRHVPRHRRAAPARICRAHRARPRVHDPRPRGCRRPDESGAPRARFLAHRKPLSDQGHVPCDLFARGEQPRRRSKRCWARRFPGAPTGPPN